MRDHLSSFRACAALALGVWLPIASAFAQGVGAQGVGAKGVGAQEGGAQEGGAKGAGGATALAEPKLFGHRSVVDGLDLLFLHGSDDEQAFTEGYLCAERIQSLFADFALHNDFVPRPSAWDLAMRPQLDRSIVVDERLRAWAAGVLRGMAARDPATLKIVELERELTVDDLLGIAALPDFVGLMCSSIAVFGEAAKTAGPLVGRNLDYMATAKLLEYVQLVVRTGRSGRADTISLAWPGLAGVVTGISDRGVFVAIHDVMTKKIGRERCVPRTVALLGLLETFTPGVDPAKAAGDALRTSRFGMGGNVMFAWRGAEGLAPGAAILEIGPDDFTEDGVTVRGPAEGQTFVACSNHYRERAEAQRCWRFQALVDGLQKRESALEFAGLRKLIRHSQVSMTLHQVCVDLSTGELAIRVRREIDGNNVGGRWTEPKVLRMDELFAEARRGAPAAAAAERGR